MIFVTDDKAKIAPRIVKRELKSMGLPMDYFALNENARQAARKASLASWFDTKKPNVLCTNVEKYLRAHKLWEWFYMRPAECNAALYYNRDPLIKFDMLRMAMQPPAAVSEPCKAVFHAPRFSTKTWTVIIERYSMMACVRPHTHMVLSEIDDRRTKEEIAKLRLQIETNEIIQSDFGGEGTLYPKGRYNYGRWNDNELDFPSTLSKIQGVSIGSSQRGRHPIVGTIDDMEDGKQLRQKDFKSYYFTWLFRTYLPMFGRGGHVLWIATICEAGSCTHLAVRGQSATDDPTDPEARDTRFDDWHKNVFKLIIEDEETGELKSVYEDHISVAGFEQKKRSHGVAEAMAEYQGEPIASGHFVFDRDEAKHGFMHCEDAEGEYMLDLRTGERVPWPDFMDSLTVGEAVDPSGSISTTSDPAAIVVVGVDPAGNFFVLDAWSRRCLTDKMVEQSYLMVELHNVSRLGYEKSACQDVVIQVAERHRRKLLDRGKVAPRPRPIENTGKNKENRIIAGLKPRLDFRELRFLCFKEFETPDGEVHTPVNFANARYVGLLKDQIDHFTDEGLAGHDDLIDALEMALRILMNARGVRVGVPKPDADKAIESWEEVGVKWDRSQIPPQAWSTKHWKEYQSPPELEREPVLAMDPYDE